MYLQDALSRFHRPGLHENRPSCPRGECVDSHPCASQIQELQSCQCTAQSFQESNLHNLLHWSLVAIPSQAPPTSAINSDSPELKQTMFCFLEDADTGIPRVFNRTFDPNCNSRIAATILDVSSPISISHHQDRTLRSARNFKNIKIATHNLVACKISYQTSQQTLDVDFITSGSCADVSEQLTSCVFDVMTIQPE